MNSEQLASKLIAAARADAPGDQVPYAFEQRVLARLQQRTDFDIVAVWSRALWRAAVPCVAISLLLGLWAVSPAGSSSGETSLSQEFENTVYAAVEQQISGADEEW